MLPASSLLNVIVIVLISASHLQQAHSAVQLSSQCTYRGYAPGGAINKISKSGAKIKPAQFESTVLQQALNYFNTGSGVSAATLGMIDAVGDVMKAAPQMTAALGVITVALGFLNKSPSPQDILNKATESVKLLSDEVNVMIDEMKDYVDAKDLANEKIAMNKDYRELFDLWTQCAREFTREASDNCQRRVEQRIRSARFQFQPLDQKFEAKTWEGKPLYNPNFHYRASAGTWQWMDANCGVNKHAGGECLSRGDVKRLEVGILAFRDYATLHLLSLKTLEATYKSHPIDKDQLACAYYRRYLGDERDKADIYVRYAKWAYEWDYIRQYEENDFLGLGRGRGLPASAFRGGYLGTKKCSNNNHCTIQCTQMIADNTCTITGNSAYLQGARVCDPYLGQVKQQLMAFWQSNVLNVVNIWEKYKHDAAAKLGRVTCDPGKYTVKVKEPTPKPTPKRYSGRINIGGIFRKIGKKSKQFKKKERAIWIESEM